MMFRKLTALCTALLLTMNLTGCLIVPYFKTIKVRDDESAIASIELYDICDGSGSRFYAMFEDIDQMEEEYEPIKALDPVQYSSFIERLEDIVFDGTRVIVLASMNPYYGYGGYTVKITYENGNFDILSSTSQLYDSGDDYIENDYNCSQEEWNELMEAYFLIEKPVRPAVTTEE